MRALVTGAGGFLGGVIARMLVARGDEVRSFSRHDYEHLRTLGIEQILGDLADSRTIGSAVRGCDIVFHVAAKAGVWGRYRDYYRANVIGTRNVVGACREHGVRQLVYTSTPSVVHSGGDLEGVDESLPYARHFEAPYPKTKAIAERLVLSANNIELATVALRPHLIWGPGDPHLVPRLVARARSGKLRRIGSATKMIDTVYVGNAADAHLLAADRLGLGSPIAGRAYFIAQGEPTPTWEFVNRILAAASVGPVMRRMPAAIARLAGAACEFAYRVLGIEAEPPMTRFVANQLSTSHWFDLSAARRDLGYSPRVSTAEGLARLAAWFASLRQHGRDSCCFNAEIRS